MTFNEFNEKWEQFIQDVISINILFKIKEKKKFYM